MWNKQNHKYWDIGEPLFGPSISLADAPMARIMRAIVICDGKIYDTFCMEKKMNSPELKFANRHCRVVMRISLPVGAENEFEKISRFKLSKPPKVSVN